MKCLFVSDLHGQADKYDKLFREITARRPAAVFLGGDLLPFPLATATDSNMEFDVFVERYLVARFETLRQDLGKDYPDVFIILGNDDGAYDEPVLKDFTKKGLWHYIHNHCVPMGDYKVYGYAFVPPSPFRLKDWERYDVSRFVPHGSISPEDGVHSRNVPANMIRYSTIQKDLDELAGKNHMDRVVFLFHTPPHDTALDRAGVDGKMIDGVPLDLHVGSIAVRRFIEKRQPLVTLHGHIHESARLTGSWRDRIGRTEMFNGAHDGTELALIDFDLEHPEEATRDLI